VRTSGTPTPINDAYLPKACRFLLVSLNIDAILAEVTIRQRRKKLEDMTQGNGLREAYTATLMRIKAQKGYKSVLGLKALMWVLHSERPLRTKELCHALGVEIGSADLDPENVPALRIVLASCLGLITVEMSSSTVRLVHFTLQEYLSGDPTLFHSPHSAISEVCLTYLNFGFVCDLSPTLRWAPSTTPLLEYASIYWGKHTRIGVTENIKILALRLLDRFDEHISIQLLHRYDGEVFFHPWFYEPENLTGFTGLHGVAFFGIEEIVSAVLDMREWHLNAADSTGNTALTWAAKRGHGGVVKKLLKRKDINPDKSDTKYSRTPLSWAAEKGHEGIVKMLLELKDVNPDQPDTFYGQTPLSLAAVNGHEGIVKMLLERKDVNPDKSDTFYGRTPLSLAAENGHEGIVKMLLELKDVNPDKSDTKCGRTPLSLAAENGHEGIVKMLLERKDVNPGQLDTFYGRIPLSWAAVSGHEGIVKMLLELRDVNPDYPDTYFGRTPLLLAAMHGHEGIVKMLLERKDINPDKSDTKYSRTPLWWAAEKGHEGIVKMLLERKDVNPDKSDTKYSRTPLWWAAKKGHEGIVKMLLERKDVNPDHPDTYFGWTPLLWAAMRGHERVVKMLLERKNACPATDNVNQTPQPVALSGGHDRVARIPLDRDEANCAAVDLSSPTPLPPTTMHPDESVAEIQFRSHDPNTGIAGSSGQPGLLSAVHSQMSGLLDHNDSTPMSADTDLSTQSPFWSRPLSIWPLKLCFRPNKAEPHPTSTQPTLLFAFDRRFIISSLILILALLLYFLPSSLLDIPLFHKYFPSVGG